ncbi:MAG: hypothetical protein OEY28_03260 [Nitrospira sp.]|nr:hypothetical protein [Nitrospira sp.]
MTLPASILNAQVQRLLDVVTHYENQQREHLLRQAREQARDIVRKAFADSRHQLVEENARNRARVQQARAREQARQQTALKQRQHARDREFLQRAWEQLKQTLLQRWQTPEARSAWIGQVLNYAARALPTSQWHIELAAGYSEADLQQIARQVQAVTAQEPVLQDSQTAGAGLSVATMDALVDGTIDGLLRDRADIEARLLAAWHEANADRPQ